ncbi:MAG: hypothetical protein NT051_05895 [Candidatus Micrarchaeota archaeon]|nr:hypothetical protein [Candidatus Micrarchaeota archaeon]
MSKASAFTLLAVILLSSLLYALPEIPTAFYGVITTTSGTPVGQTLTATIGSSSSTYVVGNTTVFSCSPSNCNYYLNAARPDGDTSSTNVVFTINGHIIGNNGTFSSGSVVRLDFPGVPGNYMACLLTLCSDGTCQATCPGGSSGGSTSNGGGSVGGGSSASNAEASTSYSVDASNGKTCEVAVKRSLQSSTSKSVLTTTLTNNGASDCVLKDFMFSDTVPENFAAMANITFSPAYTLKNGYNVQFSFPLFTPGESKVLTYSVSSWIPTSRVNGFTVYSMSAKPIAAAAAPKPPETPAVTPQQPASQPAVQQPQAPVTTAPAATTAPPAATAPTAKDEGILPAILSFVAIAAAVAIVGGAVYFLTIKGKKKGQ